MSSTKELIALVVASSAALASQSTLAAGPGELVISGDRIVITDAEKQSVARSDRISPAQLRRRFPGWNVQVTGGEDCLVCAFVEGDGGSFEVYYDATATVVIGISSSDERVEDLRGKRPGDLLLEAVGLEARCDSGDSTTCSSQIIPGLK